MCSFHHCSVVPQCSEVFSVPKRILLDQSSETDQIVCVELSAYALTLENPISKNVNVLRTVH